MEGEGWWRAGEGKAFRGLGWELACCDRPKGWKNRTYFSREGASRSYLEGVAITTTIIKGVHTERRIITALFHEPSASDAV